MSEEKFDAIIVGGGLAGCSAAIVLARAGLEVLLIERGDYCGAKNMTGGRLYGHSLEKILPNFAAEAPIERVVKHEKVSLLTEDGGLDIGYSSAKLSAAPESASYTVLRAKFDQWMAEKAEEAGAEVAAGFLVDELLEEDGRIVGISAAGEEMYADAVILADGVNSLLAQQIGMKKELEPGQVAVGAKETIRLGEEIINQRFNLAPGEGTAWLSAGDPTVGGFGGGFLYTNKDSVSIGVVATLGDIGHSDVSVPQMLERFKNHPSVAPFLEGGEIIEYSGHLVPEEGIHMVPELVRDGVLVTGDAAGFCVNLGFTVRGMDFAVESGRLAAEAVIRAHELGDFSAAALSGYKAALEHSFVMRDLKSFKGFPTLLSRRAVFECVPALCDELAQKILTVDGEPGGNIILYLVDAIARRTSASELMNQITTVLEAF